MPLTVEISMRVRRKDMSNDRYSPRSIFGSWALSLLILALASIQPATAQVTGRLSGVVRDLSGAPVAGARVALSLPDSSVEDCSTISTQAGAFFFPVLHPTFYTMSVEAPNFKKKIVTNIKIDPAAETSLPPVDMELGDVQTQISVPAAVQILQTANGEVAETATSDQVGRLPLSLRDPLNALDTLAGVTKNGRLGPNGLSGRTIDGQSVSFANITFDGVNVQESFIRAQSLQRTTLGLHTDQMSEATIVTVNPGAIYSGGSSQVAFSPKSGTNEFHASAFWLNIPGGVSSQFWGDNANHTPSANKLNQLGATVGAPLIKNRLFVFLAYENDRDRSTVTRLAQVPNSQVTSQDPLLQRVLSLFPLPNYSGSNPSVNYRGVQNNGHNANLGLIRLDFHASPQHTFGLTAAMNRIADDRPSDSSPFGRRPNASDTLISPFYSASWRWSVTPTLTNEIRAGASLPRVNLKNSLRSQFGFIVRFANSSVSQPMQGTDPQGRNDYLYNYQDNLTYVRGRHSLQAGAALQQYRLRSYGTDAGPLDSMTVPVYTIDPSTTDNAVALARISEIDQRFNLMSSTTGYGTSGTPVSQPSASLVSGYLQDSWKLSKSFSINLGVRYDYMTPAKEATGTALIPALNGDPSTAVYSPALSLGFVPAGRGLYNPDRNNFSPHFGFAWKAKERLVVRGGYSFNYVNDDLLRNMAVYAVENPLQALRVTLTPPDPTTLQGAPAVPLPALPSNLSLANINSAFAALGLIPGSVSAIDPNLRTPFVQQAHLGIETEAKGFQFALRYVGNRLEKGLQAVNRNQPMLSPAFLAAVQKTQSDLVNGQWSFLPGLLGGGLCLNWPTFSSQGCEVVDRHALGLVLSGQAGALAQWYQAQGYNAQGSYAFFGNPLAPNGINLLSNLGRSRYDAVQFAVNRRFASRFGLTANYVFSRNLSNLDDYQQGAVDPYLDLKNPKLQWAPSPFNLTHAFKGTLIYDLPSPSRFASGSLAGRLLNRWSVSAIVIDQSGAPFSLISGQGTFATSADSDENTVFSTQTRSQLAQYFGISKNADGSITYVNNMPAGSVSHPPAGALGNVQRRSFTGPGTFNTNLGIRKTIPFHERVQLEVHGEAINIFNTINWSVGDQFYQGTKDEKASFDGRVAQWTPPRTLQLNLRLSF
jgi:hypothetical protein